MDYMSMTDEDLERLEECWLEEQTYLANGGSLDVIQKEVAAGLIGPEMGSE